MTQMPKHIAIVMDGNGRWAKQRGLPRIAGHRSGAKAVRSVVEYCGQKGVNALTLFAFSLENRCRPKSEVQFLMKLMLKTLQRETDQLNKNNVRLRIIGDRSYLDDALLSQIESSEQLTAKNTGMQLLIAMNYSGRWDVTQAVQQLLQSPPDDISSLDSVESQITSHLSFADLPDPDLLIRTSGEQRISNFMLWQLAYSEIFFTDVLWPDFNDRVMDEALNCYASRQRRFGLTPEQVKDHVKT